MIFTWKKIEEAGERSLWQTIKQKKFTLLLAIVLLAVLALLYMSLQKNENVQKESALKEVRLATAATIAAEADYLPLSGLVRSVNEVNIKTEASGVIKAVYKKLGDYVSAGGVIAVIDNEAQKNEVNRAYASLQSAESQFVIGQSGLTEAKQLLINSLKSAYTTADDAVYNQLDKFYENPNSENPKFRYSYPVGGTSYSFDYSTNFETLFDLYKRRLEMGKMLIDWKGRLLVANLQSADYETLRLEVEKARANLQYVGETLNQASQLINSISVEDASHRQVIDGYKATLSGARSAINGSISSLLAGLEGYNAKRAAYESSDDLLTSGEAAVAQARAAYEAAKINLEKTYVRSPIAGTINSLSISLGDYVSPTQQAAFVSNNGSLEIVAYVTENERSAIEIGAPVVVDGLYTGKVVSLAPALDPITKKIEVKIVLSGAEKKTDIVNGQSVSLEIARAQNKNVLTESEYLPIPLSAVKILPDKMVVFAVSTSSELVALPIEEGPIDGDKILIKGLSADQAFVTDARGLREGEKVKIAN